MVSIDCHEDSEGLRVIYPVGEMFAVRRDMQKAQDTLANEPGDGRYGFYNIHVVAAPKSTFADHNLKVEDCIPVLSKIFPRAETYTVHPLILSVEPLRYSPQEKDPVVFGVGDHLFLKVERAGEFVQYFWYECWFEPEAALVSKLREAFVAINALVPAMIADYCLDRFGAIGDERFLSTYLTALASE
ncbi:MAG: hypothetical protein ROR55_18615 [Devosia sp.]